MTTTLHSTGKTIQRFVALNMVPFTGGGPAAVALAKAADVISCQAPQLQKYLAEMRQANPALVVLAYSNAAFHHSGTDLPAAAYLRDSAGNLVESTFWHNYAIDPSNLDWLAYQQAQIAAAISAGFDGCMIDMEGPAPTEGHYLSAPPINPRTGAVWTRQQWLVATSMFGAAVKSKLGCVVVVNGLESGLEYVNPAQGTGIILAGSVDGALAESWMPELPSKGSTVWPESIALLEQVSSSGKACFPMVKPWGVADAATRQQLHRFSLASYLLGSGPLTYYSYSDTNTEAGVITDSPDEHFEMGQPIGTGSLAHDGQHWFRAFDHGQALVNPLTAAEVVVKLRDAIDGHAVTWTDLDGNAVKSVTLPPLSGMLVRHS